MRQRRDRRAAGGGGEGVIGRGGEREGRGDRERPGLRGPLGVESEDGHLKERF